MSTWKYSIQERLSQESQFLKKYDTILSKQEKEKRWDTLVKFISNKTKYFEDLKNKSTHNLLGNHKELDKLKNDINQKTEQKISLNTYLILGMFIFISGLVLWYYDSQNIKVSQKDKLYKRCQSCGNEFSSVYYNGTNYDNTINNAYCIKCYNNGKFTEPALTKEEFNIRVSIALNKMNWYKAQRYKYFLQRLERWKDPIY